jgi:hypothetical protein
MIKLYMQVIGSRIGKEFDTFGYTGTGQLSVRRNIATSYLAIAGSRDKKKEYN